jgi:predicted small secreted protein
VTAVHFECVPTLENQMKSLMTVITIAALVALAGCNTVAGAGKDVQATGSAVEKAADNAKPK